MMLIQDRLGMTDPVFGSGYGECPAGYNYASHVEDVLPF